jgi:hypothetical protein
MRSVAELQRVDERTDVIEPVEIIDERDQAFHAGIGEWPQARRSRHCGTSPVPVAVQWPSRRAKHRRQVHRQFDAVLEAYLDALRRKRVERRVRIAQDADRRQRVPRRIGIACGFEVLDFDRARSSAVAAT